MSRRVVRRIPSKRARQTRTRRFMHVNNIELTIADPPPHAGGGNGAKSSTSRQTRCREREWGALERPQMVRDLTRPHRGEHADLVTLILSAYARSRMCC